MKISFQTENAKQAFVQQTERQHIRDAGDVPAGRIFAGKEASFFTKSDKLLGGGNKKTLLELQQDAQAQDTTVLQNYMTLMSHTMSEKDYAKLSEEGFHFQSMDPETAVTIVDRIKAELARSGKHIVGYTDDLDMETLAAAVGSESLARAVSDSFQEADIPMTAENLESVKQAWNMASELTPMEDGTQKYLVDNQMEPEIWNVYLAQNSGAETETAGNAKYFAQDVKGYYAVSGSGTDALQDQMDKVIEKAGFAVNEESRSMGSWLLEKGLPLTEENLQRLSKLRETELPLTEERFAKAAAQAIASGKEPVRGKLADTDNLYEKAVRVLEYYQSTDFALREENISARRQLEEIRLRMTAEVNVKLLKSGFSIDTAPMEQLLTALREAELELAKQYFPGDDQAVEKFENYNKVNEIIQELPAIPARILGMPEAGENLTGFHEAGRNLQAGYEKAQESYEALMTAPRADFGDNIQKAFANVDDILDDLGLELTGENRRAVRILGYNRMEMTAENIAVVREADEKVQDVLKKMTPASTLRMIRDGINPLEKTMPQLASYFENLPEEYEESAESFSRFLYNLERKAEITDEERESYIGIYRLLRQIEKSDGAAVGALVNTGAELDLKNLLSALRTGKFRPGKFRSVDVKVSDKIGEAAERIWRGERISDQIAKAFTEDLRDILTEASYDKEAMESYRREELAQLRQSVYSDEECIALLQRGNALVSADNLMAARTLLREKTVFSGHRRQKIKGLQEKMEKSAGLWEKLDDKEEFLSSCSEEMEETMKAVEKATWEADSDMEVRDLKLMHKQLSLAQSAVRREEYFLPMYIGGELAGIHLTLETGGAQSGSVHVTWSGTDEKSLEAAFEVANDKITAVFTGNEDEEVTKLRQIADTFTEQANHDWTVENITVLKKTGTVRTVNAGKKSYPGNISTEDMKPQNAGKADNAELYRVAKIFLQAVKNQERGSL